MDEGPAQEEVTAGLNDMAQTFMGLWSERAAADPTGRNDLITMLAHGEDTHDMITRPLEFLGNIMLLIVGGNDTTRNSISGGVLALNQFPEEYDKLKAGDKVVMWYISGNRDETVHEDADRLIIDRQYARRHVSFGFGVHRCMGNRLAEMQLRVIWEEIMKRFSHLEVTGPETRLKSNFIRGIRSLPVVAHRL